MDDTPLRLATTGNFILRFAAEASDRAEIEAEVRAHGGELADALSQLPPDQLDNLYEASTAILADAGPLASKIIRDAKATIRDAPRQQVDASIWVLVGGALSVGAVAALSVPILAARIKSIHRLPDGTKVYDFFEGVPKELPDALKQVGAMMPSLDKVAGRLGSPDAAASDGPESEPPAIEN